MMPQESLGDCFTQLYMAAIPVGGRRRFANASEVASAAARSKQSAKSKALALYVDR
jgi:hypothetical protein